jgi:hypothetical protein
VEEEKGGREKGRLVGMESNKVVCRFEDQEQDS